MHGPNKKITTFWWILSLLLMLAIFRSLSICFLKNVCFIVLNFISTLKDAGYLLCLGLHMREWACVFMEARVEGQRLILSVLLNCFSNSSPPPNVFSWTSRLPFWLCWLANEPPNSAFLYPPPHRCTQSHLAFMWMFIRSSRLCGKPLTHRDASLASEFPHIGCFSSSVFMC